MKFVPAYKQRAGRRQIAALCSEVCGLRAGMAMDRALLARQRERIQNLEGEIDAAKEIAGRLSVMFKAKGKDAIKSAGRRGDRVAVDVSEPALLEWPGIGCATDRRKVESLEVITAGVQRDILSGAVHAYVLYGDKSVGYALTRSALDSIPPNRLSRHLAEHVMPLMMEEFARSLGAR